MRNVVNKSDLSLVAQSKIDLSLKIEIFNDNGSLLNVVQSNIASGEFDIDSESDVRRTCSITLNPDREKSIIVSPEGYIWINKMAKIYIGIKNMRTGQTVWYSQGCYYFKDTSATYDATTNTLAVSACDPMIKLDGTKDGSIGGALQITIPAYEENEETGEIIKYNIIRDAMISTVVELGKIKDYMIDDFGEQNGIEQMNNNWEVYRYEHPLWNTVPYDLEFSGDVTVLSMISELRDLYPNYETFFDTEGTFIGQMIPNCDNDDIVFDDSFFQKILISEDCTLDLSSVRNVCEVWGNVIDADFFVEDYTYENNNYSLTIEGYEKYNANDTIAIKIVNDNGVNPTLKINELDVIPICKETTNTYIDKGTLVAGKTYTFRISRFLVNDTAVTAAYFLGEWQPHAVTALVDGTESKEKYTMSDGTITTMYSPEYFKDKYNCNTVSLTTIINSPFSVQKIGEVLNKKSDGEFNNITSDTLALERAEYENWKTTRLTDTITIKTKIVPFADVNIKCTYTRSDLQATYEYIIKSISHDFSGGTTTWTMYRHYPLSTMTQDVRGLHKTLAYYPHSVLGLYTNEELTQFQEGGVY